MNSEDLFLVQAIKGTQEERLSALKTLFGDTGLRNSILHYVRQNGGKTQDGEDVFQDAVILFDRNVRQGKYNGQSTLRTYFFAIAKWRWVTLRRRKDNQTLEFSGEMIAENQESPEAQVFEDEKKNILLQAIAALGERCQEILKYYKLDYNMQEIAEKCGLSTPAMAKKEAYRCRERLRKVFMDNPAYLHMLNIKLPNG